jgi:RHS repeat-associated protein
MRRMFIVVLFVSFVSTAFSYYVPEQGRWTSRDPLGDIGSPAVSRSTTLMLDLSREPNPYLFVRNRPTSEVDPSGLFTYIPMPHDPADDPFFTTVECPGRIRDEVWREHGITRGADDPSARLAHCIAHCRIARECPASAATSRLGGSWKEISDGLKRLRGGGGDGYDPGDVRANRYGRRCARSPGTCEEQCQDLLASGSLYHGVPPWAKSPPRRFPYGRIQ